MEPDFLVTEGALLLLSWTLLSLKIILSETYRWPEHYTIGAMPKQATA